MLTRIFLVFACALPVASLRASNFYVDPVAGSDTNAGTSSASAWKTITHASIALGTSLDTIHLAPGTYDPSSGETFPFVLRGQTLVGDQGRAVTILQGSNIIFSAYHASFGFYSYATEIRGVTLRGASDSAIRCAGFLDLVDVTIENCGVAGITAGGITSPGNGGTLTITLRNVDVNHCPEALHVSGDASGDNVLTATDCSFNGQSQEGVWLGVSSSMRCVATLRRCRIDGNAASGVHAVSAPFARVELTLEDCVVVRNAIAGVRLEGLGNGGVARLTANRCTIANDTVRGLHATQDPNGATDVVLNSTILFGNTTDYDVAPNAFSSEHVAYGDIGGGNFAGVNGNISADPSFVDAANGDFRLRFGSACIDAGDPATTAGALDSAHNARPIDGDLDTSESADMGAFEHAPLFLVSTGHVGTPLTLEMWGANSGTTTVFFSRVAPVAPTSTPFGEFCLNPSVFGTLLTSAVASGPPILFQRSIPNNSALVGRTFSFQARTTSVLAPLGSAYTNVQSVTIVP